MSDHVLAVGPLGFPWPTLDPFLFCVHHDDHYPAGNAELGPNQPLTGRDLGQDFSRKDGWSMYHGQIVPGFPQHPHRGFETVTLARRGYIDHSDSMGATARFGRGDVQWMTAGSGIVHAEMFPLVEREAENPTELFQIWLNLPAVDKMVQPYFTMLWDHTIPRVEAKGAVVRVVAGSLLDGRGPPPPPNSWAAREESDLAIWTVQLEPGARFALPPARKGTNRVLYFFAGSSVTIGGRPISSHGAVQVREDVELLLENGPAATEILVLQGRPIGEPVSQYGPFVMNTKAEIQKAFEDYRATRFGGWPWERDDPTHDRDAKRFARHADGRVEYAEKG